MQQTATKKPTKRPSARHPRNVMRPHSLSCMADANQVGHAVRMWLLRNVGLVCLGLGWAIAFAFLLIPKTGENFAALAEVAVVATAVMGFGVGWIVRDERSGK